MVSASTLVRLLVLTLLSVLTVAFFKGYERYENTGPELLADPAFDDGFAHWAFSGLGSATVNADGDMVIMAGPRERGAGVAVRQFLVDPGRYRWLRLAGELKADAIEAGSRFWQKGRLVLVSFDASGRMLRAPHVVADLDGTRGWRRYEEIFRVPPQAHSMKVGIQMVGATGQLSVRHLSLREARERPGYALYRSLGIGLWVVALAWAALPYLSRWRLDWPHGLIAAAVLAIALGTLVPGEVKTDVESAVGQSIAQGLQLECTASVFYCASADTTLVGKLGHVVFFAWLAFALNWAYPGRRGSIVLGLLALASISEILQFFVEGRQAQISDFLLDGLGLVLGMGVFAALSLAWRPRRVKTDKA